MEIQVLVGKLQEFQMLTKDHTLVRKCDVTSGDTSWTNSAGTDSLNSQWLVYPQNTWDLFR